MGLSGWVSSVIHKDAEMWNVDSDEERRLIERLRKAIHGGDAGIDERPEQEPTGSEEEKAVG